MSRVHERNQEATLFVGHLDARVTEDLLQELFSQAGLVQKVFMPRDKISGLHKEIAFVEFVSASEAEYAHRVLNTVKLFGQPLKVNRSSQDQRALDVGANVFVGNLDQMVDGHLLYQTFSMFGPIIDMPHVQRDGGGARGFGFIKYGDFESADAAVETMDRQYFSNNQIQVQYAFLKGSNGERHGSAAERELAHAAKAMRAAKGEASPLTPFQMAQANKAAKAMAEEQQRMQYDRMMQQQQQRQHMMQMQHMQHPHPQFEMPPAGHMMCKSNLGSPPPPPPPPPPAQFTNTAPAPPPLPPPPMPSLPPS